MGWRMSALIADLFFLCLLLAADAASVDCDLPDCGEVTGCEGVGTCHDIFRDSVDKIKSSEASSPVDDLCGAAFRAMTGQCEACSACTPDGGGPSPAPVEPAPVENGGDDECKDIALSTASDKNNNDCESYTEPMCEQTLSMYYSDSDFTGHEMCCACGGGIGSEFAPVRLFASGGPATWRGPSGAAAASLAAALSAVLAGVAAVFRCSRGGPAGAALLSEEGAVTSNDEAPPL